MKEEENFDLFEQWRIMSGETSPKEIIEERNKEHKEMIA